MRVKFARTPRRWLTGMIATLRPTVTAARGAVGVSISPQVQQRTLLERIALPRQLHERHGRQCAIAFDEFQDVVRIGPAAPATIRSELETHGTAAAYTFSGSHPGLMRDLFSDRRQAFFAQAATIELPPLPQNELADYIGERFERADRDPGDALAPLLDVAQGHPQRAMLLAHHLYELSHRGAPATGETWLRALTAAQHAVTGEIEADWDNLGRTERKIISIIAARSIPLSGAPPSPASEALRCRRASWPISDGNLATSWVRPKRSPPPSTRSEAPALRIHLSARSGRSRSTEAESPSGTTLASRPGVTRMVMVAYLKFFALLGQGFDLERAPI